MDYHQLELLQDAMCRAIADGLEALNSRQARRERFMCAIIKSLGMGLQDLDANVDAITREAEGFLDASDALDAGEERHDR